MSKQTGVVLWYEKQAMQADEMPDGLEYPDQIMFLCLRNLYAQVRMGIIPRDRAVAEKGKLLVSYRTNQFDLECAKKRNELIKRTETCISAYRKNRTLENADAVIEVFDGVGVNVE